MERIYVDTSVFGGYFETEFEQWTKPFIQKFIMGEFKLLYSQLTEIELIKAPEHVRNLVKSIPDNHIKFLALSDKAVNLADLYIAENVVGKTSIEDCRHIALSNFEQCRSFGKLEF